MPWAMPTVHKRWLVISGSTLVAAAGLFMVYLVFAWNKSLEPGDKTYTVEPGTPLRTFVRQLYGDGFLPDRFSLVWLAYLTGQHRSLKAGEYRFSNGISQRQLLEQVVSGRMVSYQLLFAEGWTFKEILQTLNRAEKLEHTLAGVSAQEIMMRLEYPGVYPEGRFYPDTYYYTAGTPDLAILRQAYAKMEARLQQEWEARDSELPYRSHYEALIMASIVEKETGVASERPQIAGVFVNRLRKGMRLQTDPTVIYGLGDRFDGNLRRRDLQRDTPYNTYTRSGLPPTPIAMPGGEAIRAALRPAKTDDLYFVSRGDGTHEFSATLQQHNRAVVRYQLGGRSKRAAQQPSKRKQ